MSFRDLNVHTSGDARFTDGRKLHEASTSKAAIAQQANAG
jgi:hypothetical protein